MSIEHHQSMIRYLKRDNERLERDYGKGCRPGWVSTDISINHQRIGEHRDAIKRLETNRHADTA